jgi:hypothetical protein
MLSLHASWNPHLPQCPTLVPHPCYALTSSGQPLARTTTSTTCLLCGWISRKELRLGSSRILGGTARTELRLGGEHGRLPWDTWISWERQLQNCCSMPHANTRLHLISCWSGNNWACHYSAHTHSSAHYHWAHLLANP